MRRLTYFLLLGAPVLGIVSGCADPLNRQEITGTITLKGQPIEDGLIQFAALDGQTTGDGAQIVKGKYRIPKEKGLSPGRYKVFIIAGNGQSGAGDASPDSPNAGAPLAGERVPPEYNRKSNVIKEVTTGGANEFNFDIP
jgi:hypothetical protein